MMANDDKRSLPSEALSGAVQPVRVLRMESFEPAVPVDPASRDACERRFVTLFDDGESARRGGLGEVRRVTNIWGESFALKMLVPSDEAPPGDIADGEREDAREAAFRREYRLQCRVSGLRGFPRVHGIGSLEGAPAILMEWVEGITLAKAARQLAVDDDGRISPLNVARIGRDLFELLARLDAVEGGIVHGDLSCSNVMVRTDRLPLAEQAEEGVFDLCLIDFGSARLVGRRTPGEADAAPTGSATIEYAAPEAIDPARVSGEVGTSADVYAAAGVLFRLATAAYPYDVSAADDRAAVARIKRTQPPSPFAAVHESADLGAVLLHEPEVAVALKLAQDETGVISPEAARLSLVQTDALLDPILIACLSPEAEFRPSAGAVRDALGAFAFHYADNVRRSLAGEPLAPCVPGSLADGYGAALRERSSVLRGVVKAVCLAFTAAIAVVSGLLAATLPAAFGCPLDAVSKGAPAGLACGAALVLPLAAGLVARWRDDGSPASFIRGGAGVLAGALVAAAGYTALAPIGSDVVVLIACALFATASAGLCFLAVDFALPHFLSGGTRIGGVRGASRGGIDGVKRPGLEGGGGR